MRCNVERKEIVNSRKIKYFGPPVVIQVNVVPAQACTNLDLKSQTNPQDHSPICDTCTGSLGALVGFFWKQHLYHIKDGNFLFSGEFR